MVPIRGETVWICLSDEGSGILAALQCEKVTGVQVGPYGEIELK